jgi:hypothetical protein
MAAATRDHAIRYNAAQERTLERSSPSDAEQRLAGRHRAAELAGWAVQGGEQPVARDAHPPRREDAQPARGPIELLSESAG